MSRKEVSLPKQKNLDVSSQLDRSVRNKAIADIPVATYVDRFGVANAEVLEVLGEFPTLCYLLGNTTIDPMGQDSRPDGTTRPIYYLTEGSGMFGLKTPDDAMRWRGIFNHVMGTARQVYFVADRLAHLNSTQKKKFEQRGFDIASFESLDPLLLRDFMFISHAGRRGVDERAWHSLSDPVHARGSDPADSGAVTRALLVENDADPVFLELMRIEEHAHMLAGERGFFIRADDNILTYCDWTYGQGQTTLKARFAGLRESGRAPKEQLDMLEEAGKKFQDALDHIVSPDILDQVQKAGPFVWETKIRRAYAASAGLRMKDVFPSYAD